MHPPRGPRSVLCVVNVTMSAYGHRVGVRAAGDEAGDVRGVEQEQRADLVGDGLERRRVEPARVAGGAGDDQLRPVLQREVAHLVHVDALVAGGHLVGDEVVQLAAGVDRRAVGEVAAVVEAETEHRVAGLQDGLVRAHVGVGAAVRLHVGVVGAEQLLDARRWRGTRSRRRSRCRRSSACPGSPRRTCW